ncbi:MAG: peptidoglycan-associated lipoprotein Pal [Alphaproteobacteria bacterium]|nr:peptidoglycan-associated lipoprotein Pal [Alphaproteobacteria bacterium]
MSRIVLVFLALSACHKKPPEVATQPVSQPVEATKPAATEVPAEVVQQMADHFAKVHFDFDSSTLSSGSMDALAANAKIMQKHPRLAVEVQGHADERGTVDYNLALGDRRAQAVRTYLMEMGVSADRVRIVSYGEERPESNGHDETAWSANRRCEFRILTREGNVTGTVAGM